MTPRFYLNKIKSEIEQRIKTLEFNLNSGFSDKINSIFETRVGVYKSVIELIDSEIAEYEQSELINNNLNGMIDLIDQLNKTLDKKNEYDSGSIKSN